jgi:hypothetical protein
VQNAEQQIAKSGKNFLHARPDRADHEIPSSKADVVCSGTTLLCGKTFTKGTACGKVLVTASAAPRI